MDKIDREIENRLLHDLQNITVSDRTFETDIVKGGKNYCSKASRLTIHFQQDNQKCEKCFFLKVPYDIQYYEVLKQFQFYAKEIYMYDTVLPMFKSLLPDDCLYPQFYGTDGKDALILEDISKCGYQMVDGHKQMDLEHCTVALKLLAKFHALGVKVHETDPQILDQVRNELVLTSAFLQSEKYCTVFNNRLDKVVRRAAPTYAEEHPEVLQFLKSNSNLLKLAIRDLEMEHSFNVLNHGDFHTNNIMFAYDIHGHVTSAKCIDFQLCRWKSPAFDLVYFSVVCMRPEVFENNFHLLLETYVTTLNATLKHLKSDQKLEMDVLLKDIHKIKAYWMYTLLAIGPLIVSDMQNGSGDGMADEYTDDRHYINLAEFWVPYFIKEGVFSKYEDTAVAIDRFIRKFQAKNGATICKYDLEYDVVKPGDNYCSGIIRMKFQSNAESSSVLLKVPSLSENYKLIDSFGVYPREVFVYENLLPQLFELWPGEPFAPVCHVTTQAQAMVLEDLQGYRTCDRKQQLDLDHCLVALSTLAKYHALSVKFLNCNHILDATLAELPECRPSMMAFSHSLYDSFLSLAESLVSKSTHQTLCQYKEKVETTWRSVARTNADSSGFCVIVHGDFWTNNILFRYEHGRVKQAKIVDWQMTRKALPVLDLIYFFTSSAQFEVFASHKDTMLDLYVDTLNETLSTLECNCRYTRADLDNDLEEYKILFPYFVSSVLQIVLPDKDSSVFSLESSVSSDSRYTSVLAKWLNYFVENGIA